MEKVKVTESVCPGNKSWKSNRGTGLARTKLFKKLVETFL